MSNPPSDETCRYRKIKGQSGPGPQELRIVNWVLRPREVHAADIHLPNWLSQGSLQPLTCLRMLKCCELEGLELFEGSRNFQQELLAAQQAMGLTLAELKSVRETWAAYEDDYNDL